MVDFSDIEVFVNQYVTYSKITGKISHFELLKRFFEFRTTNVKIRKLSNRSIVKSFDYAKELIFLHTGENIRSFKPSDISKIRKEERTNFSKIKDLLYIFKI